MSAMVLAIFLFFGAAVVDYDAHHAVKYEPFICVVSSDCA